MPATRVTAADEFSYELSAGLADGSMFDGSELDSQVGPAASALRTICANPAISSRADFSRQTRRRYLDKQVGTALMVAGSLLPADETLGNVFQQV